MPKTAEKDAPKTKTVNWVLRPMPKELKEFFHGLRQPHGMILENFKEGYYRCLSNTDKTWQSLARDSHEFDKLCKCIQDQIADELVDMDDGWPESTFRNYCQFVRNAIKFGVPMKLAKLGASKLIVIREIAITQLGGHNEGTMLTAHQIWLRENKKIRNQKNAYRLEATKEVLAERGISVVTEGDGVSKREVCFTARDPKDSPKLRVANLDSPFGLATINQIADHEERGEQCLDTLRKWFDQDGTEDWLTKSKSETAKILRNVYKAIKV